MNVEKKATFKKELFQEQLNLESLSFLADIFNFSNNFQRDNEMVLVPSYDCIQVQPAQKKKISKQKEMKVEKEIVESPNNVNNVIPKHSEHILKMRKVKELKEIVRDIKRKLNFQFHWTWRQIKEDLIEIIMDPFNPKFLEKNPNSIKTQKSRKRKIKDSI